MVSDQRCRFECNPDADVTCWRKTWRDYDNCIWHTDLAGKSESELTGVRSEQPERLDGAMLQGVQFTGEISFKNCTLDNANFQESIIADTSFQNASIKNATFGDPDFSVGRKPSSNRPTVGATTDKRDPKTRITNADFRDSCLDNADFSGARLSSVSFDNASARGANFSAVQLSETRLPTMLTGAQLRGIDLAGADLSSHTVDGADFSGANLSGTTLSKNISDTKFEGSMMNGVTTEDSNRSASSDPMLSNLNLKGVLLSGAEFTRLTAEYISAEAMTARGTQFQSTTFRHCTFEDAYLTGSNLRNSTFSDGNTFSVLDLKNADLTHADLAGQSLIHTDCSNIDAASANFSESNLTGSDFTGAMLHDADFAEATASGAIFTSANLERARFTEAELFDTSFVGAKLYGTKFAGVQIGGKIDFGPKVVYDPTYDAETTIIAKVLGRTSSNKLDQSDSRNHNNESTTEASQQTQLQKAITTYHSIEQLCRTHGLPEQEAHYFVRRQEMQRLQHHAKGRTIRKYRALLSRNVLLYGESPERLILTAAGIMSTAAVVYPIGGWLIQDGEPVQYPNTISILPGEYASVLIDSLYFSIVTFLTLGSSEFQPIGIGRWIAVIQTGLGALLLALLVYVYGRRASR